MDNTHDLGTPFMKPVYPSSLQVQYITDKCTGDAVITTMKDYVPGSYSPPLRLSNPTQAIYHKQHSLQIELLQRASY